MSSARDPEEIYLDWNSTAPVLDVARQAMANASAEAWANPSSIHAAGRRAWSVVEELRQTLGRLAEVDPRDVVLTSGATEANNLALHGAAALVTSRIEHPSVVRVAEALEAVGRPVAWLPVGPEGWIDPESVTQALRRTPRGTVVAVMAANHETGVLQPVDEVARVARSAGARLHVDAVQAVGKAEVRSWNVGDSVAICAHKVGGPKGMGALLWRGASPEPLILGGAQQRGLRAGTLDPVTAAGFRAALEHVLAGGPQRQARLSVLRNEMESALAAHAEVNGDRSRRLPHVSSLAVRGWQSDELVAALDLVGLRVSSGSACSSGTAQPSRVIESMLGTERARSTIRISLGETTTSDHVTAAICLMKRVLERQS